MSARPRRWPRERFAAQLLTGPPARTVVEVVERLLAVQAQDPIGFRLAVRARSVDLGAADVDASLNDRSLVVSWLNRGTLHLVRSEDYPWLHALTAPRLETANARRLAQLGVSRNAAERGVAAVERALADEGPLPRETLRERVADAGVPTQGQALVHLLALATLRGIVVRGPLVGGRHAFVLVRDWLGAQRPVDRDRALAELGRRYLAGHAPADDRDLAKWVGLPLRDARGALRDAAAPELEAADPAPRLLGPFDPVLHGWASRTGIVGVHSRLVTSNGLFRPFALVDGRAVGLWRLRAGRVELEPLEPLPRAAAAALAADAEAVERFLRASAGADDRA